MAEKKIVNKDKVFHFLMLGMFFKVLFTGFLFINLITERHDSGSEIPRPEEISFQFVPKEYPVSADRPSVLHVIIFDSQGNWVEDAEVNISLSFQDKEVNLAFYHVEDGLYESLALFTSSGDWTGKASIYLNKEQRTFPLKISVL